MNKLSGFVKRYGREMLLVGVILALGALSVVSQPVVAQQGQSGGNIFNGLSNPTNPTESGVWSDNIGWISLNNCDATLSNCSQVPYGVSLNETSGALSGAAWSDNIGWVSFEQNETSQCPGGAAYVEDIQGQGVVKNLRGSARAIVAPGGFWDGCISFSDLDDPTGASYQVQYNTDTKEFSGEAWGDEVIGWVSFYGHLVNSQQPPVIYFSANPGQIQPGQPTQLEWQTSNVASCTPVPHTVDLGWGAYQITIPMQSPYQVAPGLILQNTTYYMNCISDGGQIYTNIPAPITVVGEPIILNGVNPALYNPNTNEYTTTLQWYSDQTFNSCELIQSDGGNQSNVYLSSFSISAQAPQTVLQNVEVPHNPTYFEIQCGSPNAETSNIVEVEQQPLGTGLDLAGQGCVVDPLDLGWLAWTIDQDLLANGTCEMQGPVGGQVTTSGVTTYVPAGTYTLTCTVPQLGQFSDTETISVGGQSCTPPNPPGTPDPDIIFEEF